MATLHCMICGDVIQDQGSHPIICRKQQCRHDAWLKGWWDLTEKERTAMRNQAVRITRKEGRKNARPV